MDVYGVCGWRVSRDRYGCGCQGIGMDVGVKG